MKTMKLFFYVLALGLFAISCGDDGDDGNVDCNSSFSINNEIQDEIDALNTAGQAYANDPSSSNCNTWKDAATDYLNAVRALEDCANDAGQGQSFTQALQTAQAAVDAIAC